MNTWLSLQTAWRSLRVNKTRSVLTILGVIVGVAAVVCMVSIGLGAQAQISERIQTLGANLLLVTPGTQASGSAAGGRHSAYPDRGGRTGDSQRDRLGASCRAGVIPPSTNCGGQSKLVSLVAGVKTDYLIAREWPLLNGRTFSADELQTGAKVAVVGDVITEELFHGQTPIGETLRIGNVPFMIVGVLDKKGQGAMGRNQDDVVFIPCRQQKVECSGGTRQYAGGVGFYRCQSCNAEAVPQSS
jgi:putative ABC transport system permease protein